jgi:indole-3-acetate monooxygenase
MIPAPSAFLPEGVAGRIRKVAAAAEKLGRLHPDILTLAFEQQWFRSLVPKRYGGLALPLPAMVRLEEGLSWADGSLGWTVTLCSGAGWFAGFFPPASFPEMRRQRKWCPMSCLAIQGFVWRAAGPCQAMQT